MKKKTYKIMAKGNRGDWFRSLNKGTTGHFKTKESAKAVVAKQPDRPSIQYKIVEVK